MDIPLNRVTLIANNEAAKVSDLLILRIPGEGLHDGV